MRRRHVVGGTAIGGAIAAGMVLARRWQAQWGATGQEASESLPGDDLIARADLTATRAITVGVPADEVWPWIAQLGQGRGGFYSYDALENLVGCHICSADRLRPGSPTANRSEEGAEGRIAPWLRRRRSGQGPPETARMVAWRY